MEQRNRFSSLSRLATVLWLLVLTSGGCTEISITPRLPTPVDESALALSKLAIGAERDIAVLAVDFDPPLNLLKMPIGSQEVTLQVAIENKGYRKESNIQVTVKLLGNELTDVIKQETQNIDNLPPGGIKILQFRSLLSVPYRSKYRLEIEASPVPNETLLTNNRKSYDIQILRDSSK